MPANVTTMVIQGISITGIINNTVIMNMQGITDTMITGISNILPEDLSMSTVGTFTVSTAITMDHFLAGVFTYNNEQLVMPRY